MPLCNKWILVDNSEVPFTIVAEGSEDGVMIRDPKKFSQIQAINAEYEKNLGASNSKIE